MNFYLLIPLALGGLYVFGVPLLILSTFRQAANPLLETIEDFGLLPQPVQAQFAEADQPMAELGFDVVETLFMPQQTDNVRAILRLYCNRKSQDSAMVVAMYGDINGTWTLGNQYAEFSTRFRDGHEFNTNNTQEVGAFKPAEKTVTTRAGWIRSVPELYRAHQAIMASSSINSQKELQLETKFNGDASAYLANGIRKELQGAAEDGYLKLSAASETYSATLTGAYLMTWPQIQPFKALSQAKSTRAAKRLLAEAGFQS